MNELLYTLNEQQAEAVISTEGPMLILAGAGSGKTRTIIHKIAYILQQNKAYPSEILALTFTNKAAGEMKDRIYNMGIFDARNIWMSTFHSMGARILRQHAALIGYTSDFVIYDEDDKKKLIKDCLKQLDYNNTDINFGRYISHAKENRLSPLEFAKIQSQFTNNAKMISEVYALYERKLKEYNAMDFNDLLANLVLLFEERQDVLNYYRQKFKYILIDEYQDTNHVQYLITKMLAGVHNNICVCGDDDQSIYAFRGADIKNILEFERDYPSVKIIRLEQNYRSTQNIIGASNGVISNNSQRKGKTLFTENNEGEKIKFRHCYDGREEARYICSEIEKQNQNGISFSQMAILYRTNAQSRIFEEMLLSAMIPYRLIGGIKFYEREEIKDILAYLKLAVNPQDNISFMRVVNTPKRSLGNVAVQKIDEFAQFKSCSMLNALSYYKDIPALSPKAKSGSEELYNAILNIQQGIAENTSIGAITKKLIDDLRYYEYLSSRPDTTEQKTENINELIASMYDFEKNSDEIGLASYLQHVSLISAIDEGADKTDGVSLMTVHNAKGLEFDTVFLAGMEDGIFPHFGSIMEGDDEEERRLCYVGMTRAKRALYMTAAKERMVRGRFDRLMISRFVFEIDKKYIDEMGKNALYTIEKNKNMNAIESEAITYGIDGFSYEKPSSIKQSGYAKTNISSYKENNEITKKSGSDINDLNAGDKIKHDLFGLGTIISVKGQGEEQILQVAFVNAGIKNLLKAYAPITKV
ncbi:MAG: UvrD-helicase domain-containing protein [Eubacteriaceae bacterium]